MTAFLAITVALITLSISTDAFSTVPKKNSLSLSTSTMQQFTSSTRLEMNKKGKSKSKPKKKTASSSPKGFAAALRDLQEKGFKFSGDVRPGKQSPQRVVNNPRIIVPDYAVDGQPKNRGPLLPWLIEVKKPEEIAKMRISGRVAREVLDIGARAIRPGVTTDEVDRAVHEACLERGGYPSPLNYHGFPKSCCTSVNEIICHGIPDDRKLVEGDIINLDITCYVDGYHGDCSEMFMVGECDDDAKRLIQTTYDSWVKSLEFVKPGRDYKDIGAIIEDHIVPKGYSTVKNFCGHGIGSVFHTAPNILHYRNNEPNGQMAAGHTFTIEPMICEGTNRPITWTDQWTAATADGGRTAQFEHTLIITPDGVEPMTAKIPGHSKVQFWEMESEVHKGFWLGTTPAGRARAAKFLEELQQGVLP